MAANALDRFLAFFAPHAATRRLAARRAFDVLANYEAAKPSHQRAWKGGSNPSPNQLVEQGADAIANIARNLERNHDLTRGIIRTLTVNTIGAQGVGIDPQPMRRDGTLHTEYAAKLAQAWRDFCRTPEVTHRFSFAKVQRLMAQARFRDGESWAQLLIGNIPKLDHGTRVPLSLELFERDMVPISYTDVAKQITQGVRRNGWGRPTHIYVHKQDPRDGYNRVLVNPADLREISYENVLHYATLDRIGQLRGVSDLASILTRIDDLKDYEESERIAAKVAASLTAYVKRNDGPDPDPTQYERDAEGNLIRRPTAMQPGMIIDTLQIGEEIGLIDSKRPNQGLVAWRSGQLRAVAAGAGASFSSISREYDGTYSAQRQELVEQWANYAVLTEEAVDQIIRPVYEAFVTAAHLSGVAKTPNDVDPLTVNDCLYLGAQMPWIDPAKEAIAMEKLVQAGFASEVEIIRKRGLNPVDVLRQIERFREDAESKGLLFSSNWANQKGSGTAAAAPDDNADPANPADPSEQGAQPADPAAQTREIADRIAASLVQAVASSPE